MTYDIAKKSFSEKKVGKIAVKAIFASLSCVAANRIETWRYYLNIHKNIIYYNQIEKGGFFMFQTMAVVGLNGFNRLFSIYPKAAIFIGGKNVL